MSTSRNEVEMKVDKFKDTWHWSVEVPLPTLMLLKQSRDLWKSFFKKFHSSFLMQYKSTYMRVNPDF